MAISLLSACTNMADKGMTQISGPVKGDYFPPPESQGGWRKLDDPQQIRQLAGMDPSKLEDIRQWLLACDDRPFAAVVIRNGYIVLEIERHCSAKTDTNSTASVAKAVCATVLAIASQESLQGKTPRRMTPGKLFRFPSGVRLRRG